MKSHYAIAALLGLLLGTAFIAGGSGSPMQVASVEPAPMIPPEQVVEFGKQGTKAEGTVLLKRDGQLGVYRVADFNGGGEPVPLCGPEDCQCLCVYYPDACDQICNLPRKPTVASLDVKQERIH